MDRLVGRNIRFHRERQGLSQALLGECLGVTQQQIQKYERGSSGIAASQLKRISDLLRVPIASFFETRDRPPPGR
jgi:transcriptional regulator with XRE-family HTH domain